MYFKGVLPLGNITYLFIVHFLSNKSGHKRVNHDFLYYTTFPSEMIPMQYKR